MRPDDINVALLVHVLGAMVLVGGLLTAASASIIGWRDEGIAMRRFSYKTLLWVAFPGYIVMRVGAQWVEVKENLDDLAEEPGLDRHRLHHGRPRRAAADHRADPGRHRPAARPQAAAAPAC